MPAPKVSARLPASSRVMSKPGPPPASSRLAAWAQMKTIVPSGKSRVAVLDVLDQDPRGERRHRGDADHLRDGVRGALGLAGQQLPLLGMAGEHPQRVGELRLRGVDAADEHVQDQVAQLRVVEAVVAVARGDQRRQQVVAGLGALLGDQLVEVRVELLARALDLVAVAGQGRAVELELDPPRPVGEPLGVAGRRADHGGDRHRRVGLRERCDRVALAARHLVEQPGDELAHHRPPAVGRLRGEGRVDQVAQAAMVVAVDVEDVASDLLAQRPGLHVEQLGEGLAGEGRLL